MTGKQSNALSTISRVPLNLVSNIVEVQIHWSTSQTSTGLAKVMIVSPLLDVFSLSYGLLVWSCKKHNVVSLSTTKAQYHGVVQVGTKAVWIHQLLGELGLPIQTSTTIYYDNQSAI
jgi:hypothetical protein